MYEMTGSISACLTNLRLLEPSGLKVSFPGGHHVAFHAICVFFAN